MLKSKFLTEKIFYYLRSGDFPGGPVAKTLSSQLKGHRFDPWSRNSIPHAATKTLHASTKRSGISQGGPKVLCAITETQHSQIHKH